MLPKGYENVITPFLLTSLCTLEFVFIFSIQLIIIALYECQIFIDANVHFEK